MRLFVRCLIAILLVTVAVVPTPAAALPAGTTWDLARDFRTFPNQANPSPDSLGNESVWSYLQGNPQSASSAPLPDFTSDKFHISGLESWWGTTVSIDEADRLPAVGINASGKTAHYDDITWPVGAVLMHPLTDTPVAVGWTTPITGNVITSGTAKLAQQPNCGNGVGLSMWHDQQMIFRTVLSDLRSHDWSTGRIHVHKGERLYLVVDANGDFACDSTLIDMTIRKYGRNNQ